jgi:restriction endonuclease Mrr
VGVGTTESIEKSVASSDLLLILLSPRSVGSRWIQSELNAGLGKELKDRAVCVIPALIEDCQLPPSLADRAYVDLRHDLPGGVERLVDQLDTAFALSYSKLDGLQFESLVADLLVELGFSIHRTPVMKDEGFDFAASFVTRDPFGAEKVDTWFVEAKFYPEARVSVSALKRIMGSLMTSAGPRKGLVVTNGQPTSVARGFLSETLRNSGHEVRIIDGTELTSLLVQHPSLVRRYFTGEGNHE